MFMLSSARARIRRSSDHDMDFSPPSLSQSPESSTNTDYPSPEIVEPLGYLTVAYDQTCVMASDHDVGNSLPPLDAVTTTDWMGTSLAHHPSLGMSKLLPTEYDALAPCDPLSTTPYSHDSYPVHILQHGEQVLARTLSHSPHLSAPLDVYPKAAPSVSQVKLEDPAERSHPIEASPYPTPQSVHAFPAEVGEYGTSVSSASYLSEVPAVGHWAKLEFPATEAVQSQQSSGSSGASAVSERQAYRAQRAAPRRQQRRLTTKDEANFICEVKGCGKLFSRSYNYKAHLETHDENREYPFPCQVPDCNKKFVRKTDLSRHHQSVHMKERNHKCDYCGRMFARKDTLRRHMEDGCPKRFDIGTLDVRSEAYDVFGARPVDGQMEPRHQHHLPPMTMTQLRSPNHNLLEPVLR